MKNTLGHYGLSHLVTEDTWSRIVNTIKLSSRINHVYTSMKNSKIEKDWLNLSLNTYKIKCKALFLQN